MIDWQGHILVVDDNLVNRLKLSMSLQQQGHSVDLAEGGEQAIQALQEIAYDVVILDIIMPGMDGFEVLEKIKSDPKLNHIPVIVISALEEIESAVRCIEMGAEDYLPKSFDPILLRARLNSCLQKKKLRDLEKKYLQQEVTLRQSEKLATLGRLSAGMAHELNNPTAAVLRGSSQLGEMIPRLLQNIPVSANLTDTQKQQLLSKVRYDQERIGKPPIYDPLSLSDIETELEIWLDEQGVDQAWEIAPALVHAGYNLSDLSPLALELDTAQFRMIVDWLYSTTNIVSLAVEINLGAGRISEIVKALKAYSYLDQAPIKMVDIHDDLENTLVILRSKLKNGITVHREYAQDVPPIEAYGSELNQVWTNLIDNAIDAIDPDGEISLKTFKDGPWVVVQIKDNGPGIPEELRANIFDPFFTTKPPGKGTGLGLSITHSIIVEKHRGQIVVDSHPGCTRFEVRLPVFRTFTGDA